MNRSVIDLEEEQNMEPTHPGRALRKLLQGRNKTVVGAAKELGVSPNALSNIVNCHVAITPTMAIRIEQWDGGSADSWLTNQNADGLKY